MVKIYGVNDVPSKTYTASQRSLSMLVILFSSLSLLLSIQQYYADAQEEGNSSKINITFIEGNDRKVINLDLVRVYVQGYPEYGNVPNGSNTDLDGAFGPEDGVANTIWEVEIDMPSNLIRAGEELHVCIEDARKGVTLACYKPQYKLENAGKTRPEVTINFNNFP
jgi:hypothetical protein